MKHLNFGAIALSAAIMTLVTGCADTSPTVRGAAAGAAGGAGIAAMTGGDAWTGAAIGGVAGGVAGNIHGGRQQQRGW